MKETAKKQIRDTIEQKDYQARNSGDDNKGLSKTRKAQMLAELLVTHDHIRPVYMDSLKFQQKFYSYNEQTGRWRPISRKRIKNIVKEIVGSDYTRHFKQEFLNQLESHEGFLNFEEMGLDKDEILIEDQTVFNLETKETRSVQRQDYALNKISYHPDQRSEEKEIIPFIKETFPVEEERKTIQEFLGWMLSHPDKRFQKALLILGESNTGKSTFIEVVRELFEHCITSEVSLSQLGHSRRFHIHHLNDSMLNIEEDMSNADIQDGSAIKTAIQQQPLFVEKKGKDGYDIQPRCKFIIASNIAPSMEQEDMTFYEKFLTVIAPNQVPEEEQDRELPKKLKSKYSLNALFEWCLEGLERLENQNSFSINTSSRATRRKWDRFGDSIEQFLYHEATFDSTEKIPTTDLYDYYVSWCESNEKNVLTQQSFSRKLKNRNDITKIKVDSKRYFKGVTVDLTSD